MKRNNRIGAVALAVWLLAAMLTGCRSEQPGETAPATTEPVVYDSYYYFYNYGTEEYIYSDLATYQAVTGGRCHLSSLGWSFLQGNYENVVENYDERYAVFVYEYDSGSLERYQNYLASAGYECRAVEQYVEGICYFFRNEETKYIVQLLVAQDTSFIVIQPYIEAE